MEVAVSEICKAGECNEKKECRRMLFKPAHQVEWQEEKGRKRALLENYAADEKHVK
jgi:hypothetical protein